MAGSGLGEYGFAKQFASLAQSVEHAAVNRSVNGSSPLGSAILNINTLLLVCFFVLYDKTLKEVYFNQSFIA